MPLPRFTRTDIWREGKYLDLWSVAHMLSGVSTALGLALFPFNADAAFVIALLMFVAYELWEAMVAIHETPQNRVMDVVVGIAAFAPAYLSLVPRLHGMQYLAVFALVLLLDISLSVFGWLASRKAAALETKMRAEYVQRMERLRARRASRRASRLVR